MDSNKDFFTKASCMYLKSRKIHFIFKFAEKSIYRLPCPPSGICFQMSSCVNSFPGSEPLVAQAKNQDLAREKLRVHAFAPCFRALSVGRVKISIPTLFLFFARSERTSKDTKTARGESPRHYGMYVCRGFSFDSARINLRMYKGLLKYKFNPIITCKYHF